MLFMDWLMQEGQELIAGQELTPAIQEGDAFGGTELISVDSAKLLEEGEEWSTRYEELLSGVEEISE
jgi:iron(III) transport system substrate-binding protein